MGKSIKKLGYMRKKRVRRRDGVVQGYWTGRKPKPYYYFKGYDWADTTSARAFEEFSSLEELARERYGGDTKKALFDAEYVFSEKEYKEWIKADKDWIKAMSF